MSGDYVNLLKKRSLNALKWAERAYLEGDYDTAAREAEYSAQLYAKALIYRVLGEERRGHDIRGLLGIIAAALIEGGARGEAEVLLEFLRSRRRVLAELADAHVRATYGVFEYGRREAELLIKITKEVINILKEIEGRIFEGKN